MAQKTIDFENDILGPIGSLKENTTKLQKRLRAYRKGTGEDEEISDRVDKKI